MATPSLFDPTAHPAAISIFDWHSRCLFRPRFSYIVLAPNYILPQTETSTGLQSCTELSSDSISASINADSPDATTTPARCEKHMERQRRPCLLDYRSGG